MGSSPDILSARLSNHGLSDNSFKVPQDAVKWICAIQAQDFAAAKWAIGLRLKHATDNIVEQAFNDGKILRTHVLRPTWHFVHPEDIGWMLKLTSRRVKAVMKSNEKKMGLSDDVFNKSNKLLSKILEGGKQLTRAEILDELIKSKLKISTSLELIHILMHAELEGVICSGAKKGRQFTYTLFEERVSKTVALNSDEALAELTKRYFTSHGPATNKDFAWWSGLTIADANRGIELNGSLLSKNVISNKTYWFTDRSIYSTNNSKKILFLPNYDEYIVGYTDRKEIINQTIVKNLDLRNNVLFNNTILIDGKVKGTWRRTLKSSKAIIEINLFIKLNKRQKEGLLRSAGDYGKFLNLDVELVGM